MELQSEAPRHSSIRHMLAMGGSFRLLHILCIYHRPVFPKKARPMRVDAGTPCLSATTATQTGSGGIMTDTGVQVT